MFATVDLLLRLHPGLGLIALVLYFLPTIVAVLRSHRQVIPIFVINFLLGWTFVGWVVAFAWSLTRSAPTAAA